MRAADKLVSGAKRVDDLCAGGKERNDARHAIEGDNE